MPRQLWLPEVLKAAGLTVYEEEGWETRGSSKFDPVGVMWHHTATRSNLSSKGLSNLLVNGRPDLKGPLCHLQLNRDGVYVVIASGLANHAGRGSWNSIRFGNTSFIGIEAANDGSGEPWPQVQLDAYHVGTAAIIKHLNAPVEYVVGHKEWAPKRKIDPTGINMDSVRIEVSRLINEGVKLPQRPSQKKPISNSRSVLRYRDSGSDVAYLQRRLDAHGFDPGPIDAEFGPRTLSQVKKFQNKVNLKSDGIVGPKTWEALENGPSIKVTSPAVPVKSQPAKKIEQIVAPPAKFNSRCTSQIFRRGSRGNCVAVIQRRLNQLGFNCGAPDGVFGNKTDSAVKSFQSSRKLLSDGVVGAKTWFELQK